MKNWLLSIGLAILLVVTPCSADPLLDILIMKKRTAVPADYCSGISWPELTSPDFTLDVDNTDNDLLACVGGGTEAGDVNTSHCTPGTVSPGSGAQAICSASGTIQYDNSTGYFSGEQGELRASIWFSGGGAISTFVSIGAGSNQMLIKMDGGEDVYAQIVWYGGTTTTPQISLNDLSSCSSDPTAAFWVDVWVQWQEDGESGDYISINARCQDASPTWDGWVSTTDSFDFNDADQPGADEMDFGGITNNHDIIIDDVEIKASYTTWNP